MRIDIGSGLEHDNHWDNQSGYGCGKTHGVLYNDVWSQAQHLDDFKIQNEIQPKSIANYIGGPYTYCYACIVIVTVL